MISLIGETAGNVWQFLNEHPGATAEQIHKGLKVEDSLLHQALGWLAREGKLGFETTGKTTKLSVTGE
jgi:hypothetical protein